MIDAGVRSAPSMRGVAAASRARARDLVISCHFPCRCSRARGCEPGPWAGVRVHGRCDSDGSRARARERLRSRPRAIAIRSVSRAPLHRRRDIAAAIVLPLVELRSRGFDPDHRTDPRAVARRPSIAITRRSPSAVPRSTALRSPLAPGPSPACFRSREQASGGRPKATLLGRAGDPEAPIPAFSSDFPTTHRLDRCTGQSPPYGASAGLAARLSPYESPGPVHQNNECGPL